MSIRKRNSVVKGICKTETQLHIQQCKGKETVGPLHYGLALYSMILLNPLYKSSFEPPPNVIVASRQTIFFLSKV